VAALLQVEFSLAREQGVDHDVLHLWNEMLLNRDVKLRELFVEVLLKLVKHNDIALLVLAVRLLLFALHLVVRQVDVQVLVVDIELLAARPQVALVEAVEVNMVGVVRYMEKPEHSDVELPLLEE